VRFNRAGVIREYVQLSEARACTRGDCVSIQIRTKQGSAAAENRLHREHLCGMITGHAHTEN
jgi:hypothetical protein